ncbi:MAG TPA: TraR/DksA C4-type zinc finger protein [Streptosporangiaceae bacterium]|nr:TraR/DksA C4-type zinc finger protein [Streptosporangiaceae bacterium]
MTGSDLIVAAPWILFAIGLAVIYIRLLRARHAGRQPLRQSGPRTPSPADPGRPAAGSPAPTGGPRNHQLPLPTGRSMLDEQHAQPAAPAAVRPAGRGRPRWRALLEDRWQTRLHEATELSLAYHQATDVIPDGQDAGEGGPEAQQLLDRAVAARRQLAGTEEALGRLTAGTFGRCEECGSALPPGLLAVIPEARYCPSCAAGPATAINPRRARAPDGVSSPAQTAGHAVRRTRW